MKTYRVKARCWVLRIPPRLHAEWNVKPGDDFYFDGNQGQPIDGKRLALELDRATAWRIFKGWNQYAGDSRFSGTPWPRHPAEESGGVMATPHERLANAVADACAGWSTKPTGVMVHVADIESAVADHARLTAALAEERQQGERVVAVLERTREAFDETMRYVDCMLGLDTEHPGDFHENIVKQATAARMALVQAGDWEPDQEGCGSWTALAPAAQGGEGSGG